MTSKTAPVNKPSRRRSSMLNVRLKPEEHQQVKDTAERRGISVGALLREALGLPETV